MSDTLYRFYEEELVGFRQESAAFSERYPAAAGRLRLDRGLSSDPHVERMIQSFAFLNARIRKKLDDDFPELTDGLLGLLYPHFLAPVPSMTTIQMEMEPANSLATGVFVERHTPLHTQAVEGVPCRFRTCYPTTLWPLQVADAKLETAPFARDMDLPSGATACLTLQLNCMPGFQFRDLSLEQLRLHLDGDPRMVGKLYELLFQQTVQVGFAAVGENQHQPELRLDPHRCLTPVGFAPDEALLPYPATSFVGFQLLSELFAFPSKFAYVDLAGFGQVAQGEFGSRVEVKFYLAKAPDRLEQEIHRDTFRLGCTPVINLFERICEPIQLSHKKQKYKVVPDVHHPQGFEVVSIGRVCSADPHKETTFAPFYSFQRAGTCQASEAFWYASRSESLVAGDEGTDVHLHLVDPDFDPRVPAEAALTVTALCTNRNLATRLLNHHPQVDFELEAAIPLRRIGVLQEITEPLRAPLRRRAHWSLVSHLTLNHLSITDSEDGLAALKQMLQLYDFSDRNSNARLAAVNRQMVNGVTGISHRRVTRRIGGSQEGAFCRGLQVCMELDEEQYLGIGAYLFASVMRQFFSKYTSINSFVELLVRSQQREEPLGHWPPLAGTERVS